MKPPRRILDDGDEWARELISSARTDVPSEQFRRRLARQLGVAAGAAGVSSVASAKAVAAGIWLKWMAIGATASVLTLGGATTIVSIQGNAPDTAAQVGAGIAAAGQSALQAQPTIPPTLPFPTPDAAPTDSMASTAAPRRQLTPLTNNLRGRPVDRTTPLPSAPPVAQSAVARSDAAAPATTLGEELAAINSVRAALAGKSAQTALRSLDEYASNYPNGHFTTEALILRVTALSALGDHASAKRLADDFLARHPDSPYARRLRSLSGATH